MAKKAAKKMRRVAKKAAKKTVRKAAKKAVKKAAKKTVKKGAAPKAAKRASKRAPAKKSAVRKSARPVARPAPRTRTDGGAGAIASLAAACFGTKAAADLWLNAPKRRLQGAAPIDAMRTLDGRRAVQAWLEEIAGGAVV